MTTTWKIETQNIPQFYNKNKGYFLEQMLINGDEFLSFIFNDLFKKYHKDTKITYSSAEFCTYIELCGAGKSMVWVKLPSPRQSELSYNMYVKYYFIPYCANEHGIEVFDMFGIDTIKNTDIGLITRYIDGNHMVSNLRLQVNVHDADAVVDFMSKYIFEHI